MHTVKKDTHRKTYKPMAYTHVPTPEKLIHLDDRGLLAITGPDAREFLQGMITCNIEHLTPSHSLFGAHLTAQGRMKDTFFMYQLGDKVVLDCASDRLMPLAKSLHSFQMRYNIEFEDLTDDFDVYATLEAHELTAGVTTATENKGIAVVDPRYVELGSRFIMPKGSVTDLHDKLEYHNHRIKLAIPDGHDFIREKTIAGEYCLEFMNGVDYKKGCYIGQEMTARTHFRTAPKKRVVGIQYDVIPPEVGAEIKIGNLKVGNVFSCAEGHGIAIVRIGKAFEEGAELKAEDITLTVQKPKWANYDIES